MRCTVLAKSCVGVEDGQSVTGNDLTALEKSVLPQAGPGAVIKQHSATRINRGSPIQITAQASVAALPHHCGEAEAGNWISHLPPVKSREKMRTWILEAHFLLHSRTQTQPIVFNSQLTPTGQLDLDNPTRILS